MDHQKTWVQRRIAHLGVATRSLDAALQFFRDSLGLELEAMETVEDQKVRTALLRVGESRIELLEPTGPGSPISRFLETRGGGVHHVTLEVDDLDAALRRLKAMQVKLIDETPRRGAGGRRIAFVHPQSTGGLLIELCEAAED